jgi:glycosyl transferase family 25
MTILIISLTEAKQRREFQRQQLSALNLDFKFLDATSVNDIDETVYKQHYQDWQRPLKNTEVACYYSHRQAWKEVIQSNKPALILEDDALISKCVPELLSELINKKGVDLINFENRGRKKFVSRSSEKIVCNSKLLRLYLDTTGAAGYLLWPSGAKKLLKCEANKGLALADAQIYNCKSLKSFQIEPSPIIQLDMAGHYGIEYKINEKLFKSSVSSKTRLKNNLLFKFKRIWAQLKLGLYQTKIRSNSTKRLINLFPEQF